MSIKMSLRTGAVSTPQRPAAHWDEDGEEHTPLRREPSNGENGTSQFHRQGKDQRGMDMAAAPPAPPCIPH